MAIVGSDFAVTSKVDVVVSLVFCRAVGVTSSFTANVVVVVVIDEFVVIVVIVIIDISVLGSKNVVDPSSFAAAVGVAVSEEVNVRDIVVVTSVVTAVAVLHSVEVIVAVGGGALLLYVPLLQMTLL